MRELTDTRIDKKKRDILDNEEDGVCDVDGFIHVELQKEVAQEMSIVPESSPRLNSERQQSAADEQPHNATPQQKYEASSKQLLQLQAEMKILRNEYDDSEKRNHKNTDMLMAAKNELSASLSTIESLENQIKDLTSERESLEGLACDLENDVKCNKEDSNRELAKVNVKVKELSSAKSLKEKRIDELTSELVQKSDKITELNKDLKNVKKKYDKLNKQFEQAKSDYTVDKNLLLERIKSFDSVMSSSDQKVRESHEKKLKVEQENAQMKEELSIAETQIKQLTKELEYKTRELDDSIEMNSEYGRSDLGMKNKIKELQSLVHQKDNDYDKLLCEKDDIKLELKHLHTAIQDKDVELQDIITNKEDEIMELFEANQEREDTVNQLQATIAENEENLQRLSKINSETKEKLMHATDRITECEDDLTELREKVNEKQTLIDNLQTKVNQLDKKLFLLSEESQHELDETTNRNEAKVKELNHVITERESEIRKLVQECAQLEEKLKQLTECKSDSDGRISELTAANEAQNQRLNEIFMLNEEKDCTIHKLQCKNRELEEKLKEMSIVNQFYEEKMARLDEVVQEKEQRLDEVTSNMNDMAETVRTVQSVKTEIQEKISQQDSVYSDQQAEIEQLTASNENNEKLIKELMNTVARLNEDIAAIQQEKEGLEREIETVVCDRDSLEKTVNDLKEKVKQDQNELLHEDVEKEEMTSEQDQPIMKEEAKSSTNPSDNSGLLQQQLQDEKDHNVKLQSKINELDLNLNQHLQEKQDLQDELSHYQKQLDTYVDLVERLCKQDELKNISRSVDINQPLSTNILESLSVEKDLHCPLAIDVSEKEHSEIQTSDNPNDVSLSESDVVKKTSPWKSWSSVVRSGKEMLSPTSSSNSVCESYASGYSTPLSLRELQMDADRNSSSLNSARSYSSSTYDYEDSIRSSYSVDSGHAALERKYFLLVDQLGELQGELNDTRGNLTRENMFLKDTLDMERKLSQNLREIKLTAGMGSGDVSLSSSNVSLGSESQEPRSELDDELLKERRAMKHLIKDHQRLQALLNEKGDLIPKLEAERKQLVSKLDQYESRLEELETELENSKVRFERHTSHLAAKVKEKEAKHKELLQQLRSQEADLKSDYVQKLKTTKSHIQGLNATRLEEVRSEMDARHKEAVDRLKSKMEGESEGRLQDVQRLHLADIARLRHKHKQQVRRK